MGPYDDIVYLSHPTSAKYQRMPILDRAVFGLFAALTCHGAAIAETARLTDWRKELNDNAKTEVDLKQ